MVTEINCVSLVCVTETWFNDVPDEAVQLNRFHCERKDRRSHEGGVACFIDKNVSHVRLKELESDIWVNL